MSIATINGEQQTETRDGRSKLNYKRHEADRKLIGKLWHEVPDPHAKSVALAYTERTGLRISPTTCRKYCPRSLRKSQRGTVRAIVPTVAATPSSPGLSVLRKEVEAMNAIVGALDGLEDTSRSRVLTWIFDRVI